LNEIALGWTALFNATFNDNIDAVKTLVAAGANPNVTADGKELGFALMAAIDNSNPTGRNPNAEEILSILKEAGAKYSIYRRE
ncbi:MAG: hypothetical protein AAFX40_15735, partial [Cyanobacteria bacterium J06639_1]